MLAMVLALAASAAWGSADFLGGRASRGFSALIVATFSKLAGATGLAVVCVATGNLPAAGGIGWALAAGLVGAAALLALYRALALGPMSLVAPLTACGAVVPVLVALAEGETPGAITGAGMACAFAGAVVVSRPPTPRAAAVSRPPSPRVAAVPRPPGSDATPASAPSTTVSGMRRAALWHSLAAATGIGLALSLLQQAVRAPEATALGVSLVAAVVTVAVLVAITASRGRVAAPPRAHAPAVVGCGLLDVTANVLFAQATADGSAAVVAVLGSLYPLGTVLLARAWLGERLSRSQGAGVAAAMAGVALIAAG
jgi:drug/metabolite transporter (DMT)-like permease